VRLPALAMSETWSAAPGDDHSQGEGSAVTRLATLISPIERRPGMFLSVPVLGELEVFLRGYMQGLADGLGDPLRRFPEHEQFNAWIRHKFGDAGNHDCYSIIRYWSVTDMQALDSFFKLWNEFMETSYKPADQ
jgi:hypothetical protein